jgi:hypothetical protein
VRSEGGCGVRITFTVLFYCSGISVSPFRLRNFTYLRFVRFCICPIIGPGEILPINPFINSRDKESRVIGNTAMATSRSDLRGNVWSLFFNFWDTLRSQTDRVVSKLGFSAGDRDVSLHFQDTKLKPKKIFLDLYLFSFTLSTPL